MNVFLTGATGFVGSALLNCLVADKSDVTALVRSESVDLPDGVQKVVGDLGLLSERSFDFAQDDRVKKVADLSATLRMTLKYIDVVVHAAARVHIMDDNSSEPLTEFRKLNTNATLALARLAASAGVKRFVFLSSIKVNGEFTRPGKLFKADDTHIPEDPYGLSKYEAEQGLLQIAKETGMEVVIIRPPLVYGPGVKANFASMMRWINKGIPLPFGAIHNQRSLVALDNLVDFIALCADRDKSPKAANKVFLISDGEDVSTTQLLKKVAQAFNKKSWLIPIPVSVMTFFARLLGKKEVANRLFGSLQVDSSKARDLLGWQPVTTMDEQLKKTAKSFKDHRYKL